MSAVLLWSTVATAFKVALGFLTPLKLLLFSSFVALFFLTLRLIWQSRIKEAFTYLQKNFLVTFLQGIINPFLYYLVLFKAYDLLPAQEAQAINYTWALTLSYLSVMFLKQKLSFYDLIAGFLAYFGVLIIATKGDVLSFHFSNSLGVSLALFSTILWSFYWIINTKTKADPTVTLFSNFLVGSFLILVYSIYQGMDLHISLKPFLATLYIGLFEMGITFLLWLNALKYAQNTSKTANLIFLSPILSLFFIHLIVGEKIENSTIVALVLILFALGLQKLKSRSA